MKHLVPTACCCIAVVVYATGAMAEVPSWQSLEKKGAVIGSIRIQNGSIFDLENPDENKLLYRVANKLHIKTKQDVIEQQLLFTEGEVISVQALEESERILRSNRYIQDARIEPVRHADGVVDVHVTTTDTWTLVPKLDFSHSGGQSSSGVGIKEMNLFGTGMGIELMYKSDVDRDSKVLKLVDKHLGDSWYGVKAIYENNSDGFTRLLKLEKPFYSLDSNNAHGISSMNFDRTDSLYDRGEITSQYRHQSKSSEIYTGWSKGLRNGWARRYVAGLAYDEHRFSEAIDTDAVTGPIPGDRKFVYPFVGFELMQDKFEESKNVDQIARVEDRFIGKRLAARIGLANTGFGSSSNAILFGAGAQTSLNPSKHSVMLLSSEIDGRLIDGSFENMTLSLDAKYYKRQSEKRLFFARLSGMYGEHLDLDQQLYLGGDNGLRGFPLRYQSGDKAALLTLEQRLFTDWYPYRLFHVGAAVFLDAGRTWGENSFGTGNDGWLSNIGAGLRLASSRSGLGRMLHIDVAYPLGAHGDISNVQFIVELKESF